MRKPLMPRGMLMISNCEVVTSARTVTFTDVENLLADRRFQCRTYRQRRARHAVQRGHFGPMIYGIAASDLRLGHESRYLAGLVAGR